MAWKWHFWSVSNNDYKVFLFQHSNYIYRLAGTHEIAQAQQQKNARLREAFGISDYFVEGTSFDPERKAREDLAKKEANEKDRQAEKDADKANRKKYALVRTPSPDKSETPAAEDDDVEKGKVDKKKKKKRNRDEWVLKYLLVKN